MEANTYVKFSDFVLPHSIWERIESLVKNPEERAEIKKVVGHSIVDETLDLHNELMTLYNIWEETQEETDASHSAIGEPPFLRENLEKQISLLVELLKQKPKQQDGSANLSDDDRKLIKSLSSDRLRRNTRAESMNSSCETTSSGYESRCSSALSVDLTHENINVSEIDMLVQPFREDFEDERKLLLKDINNIQNALIHESDLKEQETQRRNSSPTIKDLQSLSIRLEKRVLETKTPIAPPSSTKPRSTLNRHPKLNPINQTQFDFSSNKQGIHNKCSPSPPPLSEGGRSKKVPTPPSMNRDEKTKTSHFIRPSIKVKNRTGAVR